MVSAKQQARATYEKALTEGNSAILLVKNPNDSYTLELGNLLANEACIVVLKYAQVLQPEQGSLRLTVPTTLAPRYGNPVWEGKYEPHAAPKIDATAEYPFDIRITVKGLLAQANIESPSHRISVKLKDGAVHLRLASKSWLDRDFVVVLSELSQPSMGIAASDLVDPGTTAVMASFTPSVKSEGHPSVGVKVLVDCSGSMAGDSIKAARNALTSIVHRPSSSHLVKKTVSRFRASATWSSTVAKECGWELVPPKLRRCGGLQVWTPTWVERE